MARGCFYHPQQCQEMFGDGSVDNTNFKSKENKAVSSSVINDIPREHEILINRLRAGLLLNNDKFRHNFPDILPNCDCGKPQSSMHVFCRCPLATTERLELINSFNNHVEILDEFNSMTKMSDQVHFLTFGSTNICREANIHLLKGVSQFLYSIKFLFT